MGVLRQIRHLDLWIDASGTEWNLSNRKYFRGIQCNTNTDCRYLVNSVWHHVAAVRNGSSLRMYVDGQFLVLVLAFSGTVPASTRVLEVECAKYRGRFQWIHMIKLGSRKG